MQLSCPACGTDIRADDVSLENLVAKCASCDEVFGFDDRVDRPRKAKPKGSSPIPLPKGIRVREGVGGLRITRRWFTPGILFLLFFCVFWDGFLVFWYTAAFTQNAPLIMVLFPLIHVAVGVGLTWFALAWLLNRTVIRVDYDRLTVRHGPIPWPGRRTLRAHEISQLYCEEQQKRDRQGDVSRQFRLKAITLEGAKIELLALDTLEQARFMEQEIERFLGIEDRPVKGEA
jgi:hypothetical protein